MSKRCILLLGGSFDPVHSGHIGLAHYFCTLLHPDELRLIPAGRPWQKPGMSTAAEHRIAMLKLAFSHVAVPWVIDTQEIEREGPNYTVDTLSALRNSQGSDTALVWMIGADQLSNLHTWQRWRELFTLTHLCIAARPGFALDNASLNPEVAQEIGRRLASPSQIRETPCGLSFIATNLSLQVSSTQLRDLLVLGRPTEGLIPGRVLDYIQQHHIYQNT